MEVLRQVLGDHAWETSFATLEHAARPSGGATPELASLAGKRLVSAVETNEGVRLNEARIKALTGGDRITARRLYEDEFSFRPVTKFWLGVNHKPRVQDDSYGFWRRVRLIPFTRQFVGNTAEKNLEETLRAEVAGILTWAIRGCLEWQRRGLEAPRVILAATESYRQENDVLADFIEESCVKHEDATAVASKLYEAYREWANRQGLRDREQLTSTKFGRKMAERYEKRKVRSVSVYYGIGLQDERPGPDDDPPRREGLLGSSQDDPDRGAAPGTPGSGVVLETSSCNSLAKGSFSKSNCLGCQATLVG